MSWDDAGIWCLLSWLPEVSFPDMFPCCGVDLCRFDLLRCLRLSHFVFWLNIRVACLWNSSMPCILVRPCSMLQPTYEGLKAHVQVYDSLLARLETRAAHATQRQHAANSLLLQLAHERLRLQFCRAQTQRWAKVFERAMLPEGERSKVWFVQAGKPSGMHDLARAQSTARGVLEGNEIGSFVPPDGDLQLVRAESAQ
jgi:hypothetical protein